MFEDSFKFLSISKENAGKASVGVAALTGASACKNWQERREQRCWERVTREEATSHVRHCTRRTVKRRKLLKAFERQDEAFKGL